MKKYLLFLIFFTGLFGLSQIHAQCPMDVVKVGRKKAEKAAYRVMKEISPNTGMNSDYKLTSCEYDMLNGRIVFGVELTWSAKSCVLCNDRQNCLVWGELRVSDENLDDVKFVKDGMSSFTRKCVASRKWDFFEAAINAAMNSGSGY